MEGKQASKLPQLANGGRRGLPTGTAKRDGRIYRIMTAASNQYDCRPSPEAAGLILRGLENVRRGVLENLRGHRVWMGLVQRDPHLGPRISLLDFGDSLARTLVSVARHRLASVSGFRSDIPLAALVPARSAAWVCGMRLGVHNTSKVSNDAGKWLKCGGQYFLFQRRHVS